MAFAQLTYFSQALGKQNSANVILPDPAVKGPYHCLLLLHGLSDDHSIWMRRTSIERYVDGLPLVIVMPDGGRGFYSNATDGFRYYDAIAEELPEVIKHHFKVDGHWSAAGLSMGGYGALRLGLQRPDFFKAVVSLSGALSFGHFQYREDDFGKEFRRVIGPVTPGGPCDLLKLATDAKSHPAIQFNCGTEDFLFESNKWFHQALLDLKIQHEYSEFPGDHNWEYWDEHIQSGLKFVRKHLNF
jgi:putative tributyrin esterase